MNTWKVIFATIVIFGTGVFAGALLVPHGRSGLSVATPVTAAQNSGSAQRSEGSPRATNRVFNPAGPLMPAMRKDFLKNLDAELQLSAEQRERIEKILAGGQERTKALWDRIAPDVQKEWCQVKEHIRAELTDEQKKIFEDCMKRPKKPEDRKPQAPREDASSRNAPQGAPANR